MDISRESNVNSAVTSSSNSRSVQVNYFSIREENAQPYGRSGSNYSKAKFLCSFGGRILPRPSDMKLRYVGGETKMISVPRNIGYAAFLRKMEGIYGFNIILRYQLPEEDLDALVSVSSDEDLENMMEECDRLDYTGRLAKLRVFVIHESEVDNIGLHDILDPKTSEQIFVDAINIASSDLSSSANAHSQFTGSDSSKVVNTCNPWDAFMVKFTEFQKTEATPLEEHVSSGYLPKENRTLSTDVSHLISLRCPLDDLLGESSYSDKLSTAVSHEKHIVCSANDAEKFDDLELGSLENSLASSQWRMASNSYEESKQLRMAQAHNESIHHEERGQLSDLNCSTSPYVQVDLNSLELNKHHWNVFKELDVDNWNSNMLCGDYQQKISQEQYHRPEMVTFVNYAELNGAQNILWKSGHQWKNPCHQAVKEDLPEEAKLTSSPEATAISSSVLSQEKKPPYFFDSDYLHHQEVLLSGESRSNVPSEMEKMEISLSPNYEDDRGSMNFVNVLDFLGVPCSTIGSRQLNQNVEQGDAGECMNPLQETVLSEFSCSLCSPNEVLEDELLFEDGDRGSDSEASKFSLEFQTDVETFPQRNKSPGSSSGEGPTDIRENGHICELEHDGEDLSPSVDGTSELTAVPDILCCLQPKNPKLHGSTPEPMYVLDDYAHQGQKSCIEKVVEAEPMKNECNNFASFVQTESEDLTLPSIRNSFSPKEHFDEPYTVFKNVFTNETLLDKEKMLRDVEESASLVSNPAKDAALVSLIETWERSLLHDDEQTQHPVVLDTLDEDVPEVKEKTAAVEDSGAEFEEHEFQSIDYGPVNVATVAEEEARVRGLQTIRNCDLEDLRELGSGTFGTVYHGKWRGTDVAIKRIKASLFAGRKNECERLMDDFWHEACLLSKLHHPNVVAFYGVVPDGPGGTVATVSEYMVNGSLKQVLQRKDRTLDRRKRLLIAMDAAFGMEYLHGKNVVHFDIKCENLLVNMRDIQRPICKVGDLGLSKVKQKTFISGGVRGTLPWMAPELLKGNTNLVSEKVDVFSFGIVMWELLTGEEPYANMHYGAIIGGIVNNTLRPRIPRSCDPSWRSLMEKCWAADPAERPTFSEIAKNLRVMEAS